MRAPSYVATVRNHETVEGLLQFGAGEPRFARI
jgi:hypothetical protein